MKQDLTLHVNGRRYDISVEPRKTLADALRDDCGLTGTHLGCEHGVCGACTIIADGEPLRACLMFAVQAEGMQLRTVEGLAKGNEWSPLQKAFVEHHGLQCGYCTPGFLMLATSALEENPQIGDDELRDLLSSNLCRCTGYENIVKAVRAAAAEMEAAR
jgi:carbon-monoxide dehydrogenase small subunit